MIEFQKFKAQDRYATKVIVCDTCGKRARETDVAWPLRSHRNKYTDPNVIIYLDFCSDECAQVWDNDGDTGF